MNTTTIALGDERRRLDVKLDNLVSSLADADAGTEGAKRLIREARDVDQAGKGVSYLIDGDDKEDDPEAAPGEEGFVGYGDDATVTLKPVTAGSQARVTDKLDEMQSARTGQGRLPGTNRNLYAAEHVVSAPFLDGVDGDDLQSKFAVVVDLPTGVVLWLEDAIERHGDSGNGEWTPLQQRLERAIRED